MNLGLVTSFIVGGVIMISILAMNMSVSQSSVELTLNQMNKVKLNDVAEIISHDIPKIGYNRKELTPVLIEEADSNIIVFYSNIDNSLDESVERITWQLTDQEVASTDNPNDFRLMREVDGVQNFIDLGVTRFRLSYYSTAGGDTPMALPVTGSDLNDIKQIRVEVMVESAMPMNHNVQSTGDYLKSAWEKRFSPINLRDN